MVSAWIGDPPTRYMSKDFSFCSSRFLRVAHLSNQPIQIKSTCNTPSLYPVFSVENSMLLMVRFSFNETQCISGLLLLFLCHAYWFCQTEFEYLPTGILDRLDSLCYQCERNRTLTTWIVPPLSRDLWAIAYVPKYQNYQSISHSHSKSTNNTWQFNSAKTIFTFSCPPQLQRRAKLLVSCCRPY